MSLISPSFVAVGTLAPLLLLALLAALARRGRRVRGAQARSPRWTVAHLAAGALVGSVLGLLLGWLVSDVLVSFGFGLSVPTRAWIAVGMAELGVAIVVIVLSRRSVTGVGGRAAPPRGLRILHQTLAVLLAPVALLSGAIGINSDVEEYPNIAAAFGLVRVGPLDLADIPGPLSTPGSEAATSAGGAAGAGGREGQPLRGRSGTVSIPGTESGFSARDAIVYLPPAALVPDAPELPVVIAFAGEPGAPLDLIVSARLDRILDGYAEEHQGVAPIVVIPDQLGAHDANPMCVDSPIGNSASYLTQDVPAWIRSHLRVLDDPTHWGVMGFSQGGTCAAQLGASRPDVFGGLLDIAGELGPYAGPTTVDVAFAGDQAAYEAAFPQNILARNAPYATMTALFCVGDQDQKFRPAAEALHAAAEAAGLDSRLHLVSGSAHDWRTVRECVKDAFPTLAQHLAVAR
nr:alpha/beta hydrolase-fold protein [Clavibacter sp. VKM Ac-2873]